MSKAPNRPSSGMKISKTGDVTFESNVDHVQWKLYQLCKQALYDSAKILRSKIKYELSDRPYMSKGVKARINRSVKYDLKKWEDGLKIGLTHDSWYSALQELGDKRQPKLGILRNTVLDNVDLIREAQAQYLTGMNTNEPFEAQEPEEDGDA